MTVVRGEQNLWQTTLGRHDQQHIIAKCGSHTGHSVQPVAFCNGAETASVLVEALALLKAIHNARPVKDAESNRRLHDMELAKIGPLLERAGLLP